MVSSVGNDDILSSSDDNPVLRKEFKGQGVAVEGKKQTAVQLATAAVLRL